MPRRDRYHRPGHLHIPDVRLPSDIIDSPWAQLRLRLMIGLALIVVVTLTAWLGADGYNDTSDGKVDLLDSVYYATVSITTTGYGDVVPVSDMARAVTTFIVTPMRMMFLVLLVGTSVELIAVATRRRMRRENWRKRVKDHVVICGFGVKGRSALESLLEQGEQVDRVVVIDTDGSSIDTAARMGFVGVRGDMASNAVLLEAGVQQASVVIVAPSRDDTAVLTVLTVRALAPRVRIVAAARELENAPLLRNSGANVVLTSSGSTGRMLALASTQPYAMTFLEDLLEHGSGYDLTEREVTSDTAGLLGTFSVADELVVAIFRGGTEVVRAPGGDCELLPGDHIVSLKRLDNHPVHSMG